MRRTWAVVHDLRPFGLKVLSTHWTRRDAVRAWARHGSPRILVQRLDIVAAMDRQIARAIRDRTWPAHEEWRKDAT